MKLYISNTCPVLIFPALFPGTALVLLICTVICIAVQITKKFYTPLSQSELSNFFMYIITVDFR